MDWTYESEKKNHSNLGVGERSGGLAMASGRGWGGARLGGWLGILTTCADENGQDEAKGLWIRLRGHASGVPQDGKRPLPDRRQPSHSFQSLLHSGPQFPNLYEGLTILSLVLRALTSSPLSGRRGPISRGLFWISSFSTPPPTPSTLSYAPQPGPVSAPRE